VVSAARPLGPTVSYLFVCCVVLSVALFIAGESASVGAVGINAALLLVASGVSVTTHEVAHALAARAVGLGVTDVSVGSGPLVWRWRTPTSLRVFGFLAGLRAGLQVLHRPLPRGVDAIDLNCACRRIDPNQGKAFADPKCHEVGIA